MSEQTHTLPPEEPAPRPNVKERRAFLRSTVLWAGLLHHDGSCAGCVVLDVSANGARLRFAEREAIDKDICALEVPRLGVLPCDVAWRAERSIGLRFRDGLSDVVAQLAEALPQSRTVS